MLIRNALEEDFLEIASLAERCPPMVTERNSIYHIFTRFFTKTSFVAINEGSLIGFLLGFISQDNPHEAYIHLLCVDQGHRGAGVAEKLLGVFLETVKEKGAQEVFLITKPVNRRAINFYLKNEFKVVESGETVRAGKVKAIKDYNGPGQDMVLFKRSL